MRAFIRETPYSFGYYANSVDPVEFILGDMIIVSFLNTHPSSNTTGSPVSMKSLAEREKAASFCLEDTYDREVRSSRPFCSMRVFAFDCLLLYPYPFGFDV